MLAPSGFARALCALFFMLFCGRCAYKVAPPGGPEDKTPPLIVSASPPQGTLRAPRNQTVEFIFSEWVRTDNIDKSVFVSPTQPRMKVKAYGRKLRLVPQGTLKDSTTYVIVLGSEIQDMRGNPFGRSYTLSFSTGNFMDSGQILGAVYNEQGGKMSVGTSIFAYLKQDGLQPDPVKDLPDYITQAGEDGAFALNNLRFGVYRVFAVMDYNRNRCFDPGRELIGLPSSDVEISAQRSLMGNQTFFPAREDTLPLILEKAVLKSGGQLLLTFNKPVPDSIAMDGSRYAVFALDSLAAKPETTGLSAIYPYLPNIDSLSFLALIGPTAARKKYRCKAIGLRGRDGSLLDTARGYADFGGNPNPDTVAPELLFFSPSNRAQGVPETDTLRFQFSEPVRPKELAEGLSLQRLEIALPAADTLSHSDTLFHPVGLRTVWLTPLTLVAWTDSPLVFAGLYRWRIRPDRLIDLSGNYSTDTMMTGAFAVIAEGEYGTISGQVKDSRPQEVRIQLLSRMGKKIVEARPDKDGYYMLRHIPEGDYRLMAYWDANGNLRRDPGRLVPFAFAEREVVAEDSLRVRKRWDIEQVDILFHP
jgi:hypothetical protein